MYHYDNKFARMLAEATHGRFLLEKQEHRGGMSKSLAARVSVQEARELARRIGVNLGRVSLHQFWQGCNVELEHSDVFESDNNKLTAAKIARDHLREKQNYYTLLQKVEKSYSGQYSSGSSTGTAAYSTTSGGKSFFKPGRRVHAPESFSDAGDARKYADELNRVDAGHEAQVHENYYPATKKSPAKHSVSVIMNPRAPKPGQTQTKQPASTPAPAAPSVPRVTAPPAVPKPR